MAGGRRGRMAAIAALVAVGVGLWWLARRGLAREVPALGSETVTVVPGVHHLAGLGPSPAYAVETPAGIVLVDSGLEADAAAVKAALGKLRLDWHRMRAILLTHAHGDHTGGAERLRAETKAKVYAGRGDAAVLRAGGPKVAFFSNFDMPNHEPHPTTVDVELAGGESLDFGGVALHAIAAPGHSPGSICYLLERGGERILFGGDVVMHPNDRDSFGTYTAYLAPAYRGDARAFLDTVRQLRSLPEPTIVLPGHPVPDPPRSPRLGPGRWAAMLDEAEAELARLVARFEADGPGFLDARPKRLRDGLFYLGDRDGLAVYALTGTGTGTGPGAEATRVVLVNAPGGPGLDAFARERLAALGVADPTIVGLLLTTTDPAETTGLDALAKSKIGLPVVAAPAAGLEAIKGRCGPATRVVSAEEVGKRDVLLLSGATGRSYRAGGAPLAAYRVERAGKRGLFTGGGLIAFDRPTVERWRASLAGGRDRVVEFLDAVLAFQAVDPPDLWLPARPSEGQNAYLYDDAWRNLIAGNYQLAYQQLAAGTSLPAPLAPPREAH